MEAGNKEKKKTEILRENLTKYRIVYLYQLLQHRSDAEHPITTNQLIRMLKEEYGIDVNRNTIGRDLEIMHKAGLHIEVKRSTQNRYYYDGQTFEVPELKMLIDAVSSAKFITGRESEDLITKLLTLANAHNVEKLRRHISVAGRVKSENEKGYYIIDSVNDAIDLGRKISFRYTDYDSEKNRILRNNGQPYIVSPYALVWDGDFYYMIGYCENHSHMQNFRLDRIESQPEILPEVQTPPPADFRLAAYTKTTFRMFDSDEVTKVTLYCRNDVMKYIIDRFGREVDTQPIDEGHFVVRAEVSLSPTFYRWIFGMQGAIQIAGPESAGKRYREMAESVLAQPVITEEMLTKQAELWAERKARLAMEERLREYEECLKEDAEQETVTAVPEADPISGQDIAGPEEEESYLIRE